MRRVRRGSSCPAQSEVARRLKAYADADDRAAIGQVQTAIHEAGHAVVALALGGTVEFLIARPITRVDDGVETDLGGTCGGSWGPDPIVKAAVAAAGALAVNDAITTEDEFMLCGAQHDWRNITPEGIELARPLIRRLREEIARLALVLVSAPKGLNERGVKAALQRIP